MTDKELQRRKLQSIKSNPQKYYKECLKKGCCKNCTRNQEREIDTSSNMSLTPYSQYFNTYSSGFGSHKIKRRYCAATGQTIANEYLKCQMWTDKPISDTEEND